jgi:hypothetical protein
MLLAGDSEDGAPRVSEVTSSMSLGHRGSAALVSPEALADKKLGLPVLAVQ